MGREVRAKIEQLREKMAERGMDAYLIPTSDFHGSEYVSGYFKCRKYMTGFTGSAGTAVITMEDAGLWTDGRYFVQAAAELSGSGVELYRSGQEGVPTTLEFLKNICRNRVFWVLTAEWSIRQRASASRKHCPGKRYAFRRVRIWLEASGTTARRFR